MRRWRRKPVLASPPSFDGSSADPSRRGDGLTSAGLCRFQGGPRMCGIIGYVGRRASKPLLLHGLKRLEYRGYDSAGIALLEDDGLDYTRAVGPLDNLVAAAGPNGSVATTGLGHTRWATHGGVTEANAHPLTACAERELAIALDGIVTT